LFLISFCHFSFPKRKVAGKEKGEPKSAQENWRYARVKFWGSPIACGSHPPKFLRLAPLNFQLSAFKARKRNNKFIRHFYKRQETQEKKLI
jgi:hypothetical protein